MHNNKISRRSLLIAGGVCAVMANQSGALDFGQIEKRVQKGQIRQAVSQWCYNKYWSLDELCEVCKRLGILGIDLQGPKNFPTLKKHGMVCTMVSSHALKDGLADTQFHEVCIAKLKEAIEASADAGYPNVISFSGNARGIPEDVGVENAVKALKQVVGFAERKGVTICLEYLNSKVNHKDYMFDNIAWGVEVCQRVGSDRVKILYDIYHAQIMEGDIIRTIEKYHPYIGHYHTGGNPGRHDLDETQEIYYPPIMKAIVKTGYKGYVAHEFTPSKDPLVSLSHAVKLCDV